MTNKLVVIINSLKVPKIKKILLYEMKFLVPNYSCLQISWLPLPDPRSLCPPSSTEFIEPTPPKKIPGYATGTSTAVTCVSETHFMFSCLRMCFGPQDFSLPSADIRLLYRLVQNSLDSANLLLNIGPASWSSGQSLWLLIMRSRVRFPALL